MRPMRVLAGRLIISSSCIGWFPLFPTRYVSDQTNNGFNMTAPQRTFWTSFTRSSVTTSLTPSATSESCPLLPPHHRSTATELQQRLPLPHLSTGGESRMLPLPTLSLYLGVRPQIGNGIRLSSPPPPYPAQL